MDKKVNKVIVKVLSTCGCIDNPPNKENNYSTCIYCEFVKNKNKCKHHTFDSCSYKAAIDDALRKRLNGHT